MEEEITVETTEEEIQEPQTFGQKMKEVGKAVVDVLVKNPMMLIPVISGIFGIVGKIASIAAGNGNSWNEHYLAEDEISGESYRLRHPLTNDEILELSDRMVDGETKGEALDNMGLLKSERRRRG